MGDVIDMRQYLADRLREKIESYIAHQMPLADGVEYLSTGSRGAFFHTDLSLREPFPRMHTTRLGSPEIRYIGRPSL